jgi:hypothetical protein
MNHRRASAKKVVPLMSRKATLDLPVAKTLIDWRLKLSVRETSLCLGYLLLFRVFLLNKVRETSMFWLFGPR